MKFYEKLHTIRKKKGLSQEKLAENIGVSRQAVAKWENGQSYPDIEKLIDLSNLFKVSIDHLIKEEEDCSYKGEKQKDYAYTKDIVDFLCRAKKATYAGNGKESSPSRPSSHDLHYAEGSLLYIDTFLGGEKFAGEEALWLDKTPFWSMNYIGRVLSKSFSGNFLSEALLRVPKNYPYRGPMVYQNGEYSYHCIVNGEFEWFNGYEEIFYNGVKVYECHFHGGSIK